MAALHITDIEAAINWWRERRPSPDGITACAEVRALAEVYALLVYDHQSECNEDALSPAAREAWLGWPINCNRLGVRPQCSMPVCATGSGR